MASELNTRTVADALRDAAHTLAGHTETPLRDAQHILAHVIGTRRETLIAHNERLLSESESRIFAILIEGRQHGTPIAYLTNQRAFYDQLFHVTPDVLIPRPETEHIIELVLDWARTYPVDQSLMALDVGTGSGAIGVTLAARFAESRPNAWVIGSDVSIPALRIARLNAAALTNIRFVQADLLEPFGQRFQIIAANLPYIPTETLRTLEVAQHEPLTALDGGPDGLDLIRRFVRAAPLKLARPGLLVIEHGADQGQAALELARQAFPDAEVTLLRDDAGLDRIVRVALR